MLEKRKSINLLRASILLLILPVMYISLWISISAKEMLTYSQKVMLLMSYSRVCPESTWPDHLLFRDERFVGWAKF